MSRWLILRSYTPDVLAITSRASYMDGKMTPSKPGTQPEARPCAANDGTTITIEDLFFNVPQRRKALRSSSEEYARIYEVVSRYAIHNSGVSIVLKKVSFFPSP
jgi:DNA mismatch repair protein MLH1